MSEINSMRKLIRLIIIIQNVFLELAPTFLLVDSSNSSELGDRRTDLPNKL